jgi:two-component system phosphate regulon sensor histidine kinase PhoR
MITRSVNGALGFISEFNALRELEEKHEIPQNQIFDLTAIINEVLGHFQSEMESRKIEVHFNTSQKIELNSVPSFVRHIMLNLISNAVKYSPDKGSIFITISQSDNTRISIEDQGMGIKPENLDRIFERFFRAPAGLVSAKSNGLGLSLVKLLVEKLNGKITVKSTLNKGSEFIVSIP